MSSRQPRVLTHITHTDSFISIRIMAAKLPEIHSIVKVNKSTFEIHRYPAESHHKHKEHTDLVNTASALLTNPDNLQRLLKR